MKSRARIGVTQSQRLHLSLGLSASLRLLRADAAGLTRYLEEQAAENPALILQPPPPGDWLPRWQGAFAGTSGAEAMASAPPGLMAVVMAQIAAMGLSPPEADIALALVEALEPSGWLGRDTAGIAADLGVAVAAVETVLARLQRMEPAGLFARSLAECLRLQAAEAGLFDAVMAVILDHLDLMAAGDVARLAHLAGVAEPVVLARFRLIRRLDPKPGAQFAPMAAPVREPDLILRREAGGWEVSVNRSALPALRVAEGRGQGQGAARAVLRMVERRNATLQQVGQAVLSRQQPALEAGLTALRPLTMAEVAEALGLAESTVSRVVAGTSIDTPRGTWWLRALFSGAVGDGGGGTAGQSAAALRARLAEVVAAEPPGRPLSDAALGERLAEGGAAIARRTVAKYREMLGIPPAHRRRGRSGGIRDTKGRPRG